MGCALELVSEKWSAMLERSCGRVWASLASAKGTNDENYLIQKLTHNGGPRTMSIIAACDTAQHHRVVTTFGLAHDDTFAVFAEVPRVGLHRIYTTEDHPVFGMLCGRRVWQRGGRVRGGTPGESDHGGLTFHLRSGPGTEPQLLTADERDMEEELYDHEVVPIVPGV